MARVFARSRLSKDKKIVDKMHGLRGNLYEVVSLKDDKKIINARQRDFFLRMYDATSAISREGINGQFIKQIQGYSLHHPNLLEIYDVDMVFDCDDFQDKTCRTTYLLILYELSSGNLEHWLDVHKKQSPLYDCVKIINDLFQALYYLHRENYTHRRLHTSNILMVEEPPEKKKPNSFIAKLGDFQDLSVFYQTEKHMPLPTTHKFAAYAAPEILLDYEQYLPSADIWSVGILMYEILFGKGYTPFYVEKEDRRLIKNNQNQHILKNIFAWLGTPDIRWRETFMHHQNIDYEPQLGMSVKDKFRTSPELRAKLKATGYLDSPTNVPIIDMLIDLMDACLQINPNQRITAEKALHHLLFRKFNLAVEKYPKQMIPKTPCLLKGRVFQIRKEIIQTTAKDIHLGFVRYYPALLAIYIFDRVLPFMFRDADDNLDSIYKVFCASYLIAMKLLVELEHPQNNLVDDIKGIVCGNTEENRFIILHLERQILTKLNFKLYPNEITALPVTLGIFKTLENEPLDPALILRN